MTRLSTQQIHWAIVLYIWKSRVCVDLFEFSVGYFRAVSLRPSLLIDSHTLLEWQANRRNRFSRVNNPRLDSVLTWYVQAIIAEVKTGTSLWPVHLRPTHPSSIKLELDHTSVTWPSGAVQRMNSQKISKLQLLCNFICTALGQCTSCFPQNCTPTLYSGFQIIFLAFQRIGIWTKSTERRLAGWMIICKCVCSILRILVYMIFHLHRSFSVTTSSIL